MEQAIHDRYKGSSIPEEGDGDYRLDLLRWMLLARHVDALERDLVSQGKAYFCVSGAGHESIAAVHLFLRRDDFLHLHYRDKALLTARGVPLSEFFQSLFGKHSSHSAGRQMSAHFSAPELNVASIVGPVGNNALHAVGTAAALKEARSDAISVCMVGDGSSQQGEFFEAVAEAVRSTLPVLFIVEDNGWAISTRTAGKTFFNGPHGPIDSLFGVPIHRLDGADPIATASSFESAVSAVRRGAGPSVLILSVERAGSACLDSAPRNVSGFLPGYVERGALRFGCGVGRA